MNKLASCKLMVAAFALLWAANASAAPLARQCGAFGIVTYDPLPDPTSPEAYTRTTDVPVPYAWLVEHNPNVQHEYSAYESSAKATAANGRKVWECYVVGLDPQEATDDFKITSFPMKADGTPDFDNIVFDPPQSDWNVSGATPKLKGAATLEGPWTEVPDGGDSSMKFFKVVVELP